MNIKKLQYVFAYAVAAIFVAVVIASCSEERYDIPDYTRTGEEVTLKVGVSIPVMDVQTRADLDELSLNQVNSLWIRTYSYDSGKATSDWYKVEEQPGFDGNIGTETTHANVTLKTRSGASYIVAVANVANMGVTKGDLTQKPLSELLTDADTWEKFLDIAAVTPSSQNRVNAPAVPITMTGCFSDVKVGGTHPEPTRIDGWQKTNFQPYFIPVKEGTVDFTGTGAIHLRRLVSQINFNVKPGPNVDVIVNSYQVMNAPRYSWLYERSKDNELGLDVNFGDAATSAEDALYYYSDVAQYGSAYITTNNDGSSSFDFWQGENKHTGVASLDTYSDRGLRNGTLFTNLTGDVWTPNNEASYVILQCTVDYKDSLHVNDRGEETDGGTEVYRSGEATYIIHLGYISNGATDAEKARDFNCFRNVDYNYNVTVNGLNDIRVDAFATDANPEINHGEEGIVVDLFNETIDLDAHYSAFNIQLTQAELSAENFGFIITAYENGDPVTITDANIQENRNGNNVILDGNGTVIPAKYYNWIELRPTSGETVLAEYRPRYGNNSDGKTFLLTDLYTGESSTVWDKMTNGGFQSDSGWYTVFVNEYTYEPMYTGTNGYADEQWNGTGGRPNWMGYVNQNPRRFYIRVTQSTSPDGNSLYARSKYGVSQQSLMTYYSDQDFAPADGTIPPGTAIAVERVNETLGMNLVNTFGGGTSNENGRWNVAQWLNADDRKPEVNLSINSGTETQRPSWEGYIESNAMLSVGAISGLRAQGGLEYPARTFPIPGVVISTEGADNSWSDPQPNNNYRIEAINACMSRNRDNNGNGRIEPDELRWYVPAMEQYLQMMIGTKAVPSPLMEYTRITRLPYVNNNRNGFSNTTGSILNDFYSRYMFMASNDGINILWGVEGTSLSDYGQVQEWSGGASHPWQVRCIRNLGANLTTVTKDNKVSHTYTHNAADRSFSLPYFGGAAFRANPYTSNGTGSGQMPNHTIYSNYNRVYYGFEYDATDIRVPQAYRSADQIGTYIYTNPCSVRGTGWRVPNQVELSLICDADILSAETGAGTNAMWISCTTNYFAYTDGMGNDDVTNKYFLTSLKTNGTQANPNNVGNAGADLFVRCVRDRNQ